MDIRGLGDKLAEQLIEKKTIQNLADLYSLTADDVMGLERMGEKSAKKLIDAIESSKKRPLSALIAALGIRFAGERVAEILAGHFGSMTALRKVSEEELSLVDGIGPVISSSVAAFFNDQANEKLLSRLEESGLAAFTAPVKPGTAASLATEPAGGVFSGMTVVFTGEMSSLTRGEAEKLVKAHGGKTTKSVSAGTSLVVYGGKAGSKLAKAAALGVKTINETEFLEIVSNLRFQNLKQEDVS
jgi:DNA ligase (NAD+)